MWQTRESLRRFFGRSWEALQMNLIYDVAHNIAKIEEHTIGGRDRKVCVHRKGATRAFPAGHPEMPAAYRQIGQPVIIPATWAGRVGCWSGSRAAWSRRSAPPATGRAA